MTAIENLNIEIIACPIIREPGGLAMSSRNARLTKEQRNEAPLIYQTLRKSHDLFANNDIEFIKNMVKNQFKNNSILQLEYFEIADLQTLKPTLVKVSGEKYRAFIAVFADTIRLIDNIALN